MVLFIDSLFVCGFFFVFDWNPFFLLKEKNAGKWKFVFKFKVWFFILGFGACFFFVEVTFHKAFYSSFLLFKVPFFWCVDIWKVDSWCAEL